MQNRSTKKPPADKEETLNNLDEFFVMGVTSDGEYVYIHSMEDDIKGLEFIETLLAGFRSEVLSSIARRFMN